MIAVTLEGMDELKKAFKEASETARQKVAEAVARTTLAVHNASVKRIQNGPASGIVYELYMPRRTHQASAPGEPPMSDTGRLASSIQFEIDGLTGYVFTPVKYGTYQSLALPGWLQGRSCSVVWKKKGHFMEALKEILS